MTKRYVVTGRIVPDREVFKHDNRQLCGKTLKNRDFCVDICVNENKLVASIVGELEDESDWALWDLVTQAERTVLSVEAFTSGRVLDVDLADLRRHNTMVSVPKSYTHDLISKRKAIFSAREIWDLCTRPEGVTLQRCLNELRMALKESYDAPFYCYRAIEMIRLHIALESKCGNDDKKQWKVTWDTLGLKRETIVENLAKKLRHGQAVRYGGEEWRRIVSIGWEVTEAYMKLLNDIATGQRGWPDWSNRQV